MQPLKKFSSESIRAIARNPNIDLQSIGIYPKSDIQHHIRTQQFQELFTKMDTIQRQSIDQNLRKLAETAGFSDVYAQEYSGYFKDIKDFMYLNGEKYSPQDISPINISSFINLLQLRKIDYIIRNVLLSSISFLKKNLQYMRNTHTSKQTNKRCTYTFCRIFGIFSTIINKSLLDAQIKEYSTKLSTTPNTNDNSQNKTNTTPIAPQLQNLNHNDPLSLVPRNFRIIALTDLITSRSNYPHSPIQHIINQQPSIEDTNEQITEQPHTTNFRFQKNYLFSPR